MIEDKFVRHTAPDGRDYYWLTPGDFEHSDDQLDDLDAVKDRYIAITPLHFDLTHYQRLANLRKLDWNLRFD